MQASHSRTIRRGLAVAAVAAAFAAMSLAQALPSTAGETLSGKPIVLAGAVRGRATVLLMGFSKDGGMRCGDWVKTIHADAAMAGVRVYQAAMLAGAPAILRGVIKSGMRKGMTPSEQDNFVVLTADEKLWRSALNVTEDNDPYVVLFDAAGTVLWHGHGAAKDLEPLLRTALR
jgi:hypothetical protein